MHAVPDCRHLQKLVLNVVQQDFLSLYLDYPRATQATDRRDAIERDDTRNVELVAK